MFGLSFGELVVLVIVAVVVIGPKDLPKVLRKLGQWAGKARRMAADLRAQSGIDDVLREGDIGQNIAEIRKLARGEIADITQAATVAAAADAAPIPAGGGNGASHAAVPYAHDDTHGHGHAYSHRLYGHGASAYDEVDLAMAREREYPREGADSYRALPDHAVVYHDAPLPPSKLADDPLYAQGVGA